jgi:mannose-6-phosphate isomerase-like protein (cupin superfamily)
MAMADGGNQGPFGEKNFLIPNLHWPYGPSRAPGVVENRFAVVSMSRHTDRMADRPVDLAEKFALFSEHWSPKVVARLNDYEIKVVKVQGEFVWHTHEDTDELFLVTSGELTIRMHGGDVVLGPGQLFVVPRGVAHCPFADGEVQAILMEPIGVINTGAAGGPLTAAHDDSLA